jgi:hypothetical protein
MKKKMNELELTSKILDYMTEIYSADYIGSIEVKKSNDEYQLILGIPSYMTPTSLSINCSNDEQFLDYIYKELRVKNYMRKYTYKVVRNSETKEE